MNDQIAGGTRLQDRPDAMQLVCQCPRPVNVIRIFGGTAVECAHCHKAVAEHIIANQPQGANQ